MFISGSGLVGGGKIFWLVFSGELSKLIQAHQSVLPPMFPREMSFTLPLAGLPLSGFLWKPLPSGWPHFSRMVRLDNILLAVYYPAAPLNAMVGSPGVAAPAGLR